MYEGRKHAILFAVTILCARKLTAMEPDKPNLAKEYIVETAIRVAVLNVEKIDKRWPAAHE